MLNQKQPSSITGRKDKNNNYVAVSDSFCDLFNFDNHQQVKGISEYSLAEHALDSECYSATTIAEDFIQEDIYVMQGKTQFILTVEMVHNHLTALLVHKKAFIEHNKIAGTEFHAILMPNFNSASLAPLINNPDIYIPNHTIKFLDVFNLNPVRKYKLTKRELQCAQLIAKGCSAYDIALELGLSKRTVEFYIRNIKDKLNVKKSVEIVSKMLNLDL